LNQLPPRLPHGDPLPCPALMLSGGGKLGDYHIGVVRTLLAEGLLPRIISGASAGAFVGAIAATRTDDELKQLFSGNVTDLSADGCAGIFAAIAVALSQTGLRNYVAGVIPDWTLEEARRHSGRCLNVVVADAGSRGGGVVLNADTEPHVLIRDAVVASCAIPMVYPPTPIHQRLPDGSSRPYANGRLWMDGSIHADLPSAWLRDHYGADQLIASIVTPYELPFLMDPDHHHTHVHGAASIAMDAMRAFWSTALDATHAVARYGPDRGRTVALWKRLIDQRIDADVIIAPGHRFQYLANLTERPTLAQLTSFIGEGDAATRAKLNRLRQHVASAPS